MLNPDDITWLTACDPEEERLLAMVESGTITLEEGCDVSG